MNIFKKFVQKITDVQAKLILSFVFLLILPLFAILFKMLKKGDFKSSWAEWILKSDSLEELKKQY